MVRVSEPIQQRATNENREDRVDRSLVFNAWIASAAKLTLRILVIAVFLYALGKLIGAFWAGVLPVVLSLIVCTVLGPIAAALRRHKVPDGWAAFITLLLFMQLIYPLLVVLAIVDSLFDFRGRLARKNGPGSANGEG